MAREIVEIIVRERGAKATSKSIKSVGRTAKTAAKAMAGLLALLVAMAGVKGFLGVAKGAIETSAAFEAYGVRLGALLGSQTEANKALENFTELASKTPFAVSQIVEGAAALGAVTIGNREKLERLTQTTANLSAVTGLSFQEAAGNLQRSLSAGIAAADLFRDRGVKNLIESIAGIPDATKLSAKELEEAFQTAFGEGGVFGNAAENLSKTLGGALSNIADASTNLQKALGDTFAGPTINAIRDNLLPFLNELQSIVENNEEAFQSFARDGLEVTIQVFALMVKAAIQTINVLNKLRGIGDVFQGILGEAQLSDAQKNLESVRGHIERVQEQAETPARAELLELLEARADEASGKIKRLQVTLDDVAESHHLARAEADKFTTSLDALSTQADAILNKSFTLKAEKPEIDAGVDLPVGTKTAAEIEIQSNAVQDLTELTTELRNQERARLEPLNQQLHELGLQVQELVKAGTLAEDLAGTAEGIAILQAEIADVEATKTAEAARQVTLHQEIARLVAEAAAVSPQLANEIQRAADAAVAAGGGLEKVNDELESVVDDAKPDIKDAKADALQLADTLGDAVDQRLGAALKGAVTGEGFDAMELLADVGADFMSDAMEDAFEDLKGAATDIFGKLFSGIGIGGALGNAIAGGVGAALAIIPGALADTETEVTNSLVQSAADATQAEAQRGVIAGPTSIPIFQVGSGLEAAMGETESLLASGNATREEILEAILASAGISLGGLGESAGDLLSNTSAGLS